MSNVSLMAIHHSESLAKCSAMCDELCACFGFNPQQQNCRVHQSCNPSDMTVIETGWRNFYANGRKNVLKSSCMEILQSDPTVKGKDGVYSINVTDQKKTVYCDMTTDGGGWTVIQKRQDGSTDLYKTWAEYKKGFGDPSTNYWIGNDAIHTLTMNNQELRVDLLSFDDATAYALYSAFNIGDESSKYRLTLTGYSGTAGDSLGYHNGQNFSTWDQDNDVDSRHSAVDFHGAWWYYYGAYSNLKGEYAGSAVTSHTHPVWFSWKSYTTLKGTVMQIKHKN
ncbi:ficolin-1-like [Ostrea edulis]|uniref:ficolin-1-like n=1 Tax=Ostrea edulis TaxID=37623 RepID=UPI0024AED315|nr:ficolin-1-like [Ostrea edulis]